MLEINDSILSIVATQFGMDHFGKMSTCSTPASTEVQDTNQHSPLPSHANLAKHAEECPLQHQEDMGDNKQQDGNHAGNVDEYEDEDEDEDEDFNPFLKETHSVEASSSLSSEIEGLDTDVADSGEKTSAAFLNNSEDKHLADVHIIHPIEAVEHGEEFVSKSTVSSREACEKRFDIAFETITRKECNLITQSENGSVCCKENGLDSLKIVTKDVDFDKLSMNVDPEDAICMRTRARYSLASFTLDELETFLQETDDDDDLQNVDDEEEYRKFLAAVLQGRDDSRNLHENTNADDEDEDNDADFELELEEALESDPDEIEERHKRRRNRRQRGSLERNNKFSGQLSRPLRPLLPFAPMGSFPAFNGKHLMSNISPQHYLPPVNNCFTSGFTSHQIGQLHCLFHEHLQLLIQVFSLCVFDPVKGHIALELKELILGLRRKCDQVLAWRSHPYPRFCFILPYIHPSVPVEFHEILPPQCSEENVECEGSTGRHSDITYPSNRRCKDLSDDRTNSFRTEEHTSCVPYLCGPLLTVIDVAPLRLVGDYIDDIYTAVSAYERYKIDHGFESVFEKEPLFPLPQSTVSSETEFQGDIRSNPLNSSGRHSPSSNKKMPKKTMAATLVEKAKKQSVALVPKEIAKLAQRFLPLFNPALYPHKPPTMTIANRVLFTDAEDELLALGMMEYNTNWKAIQQRFLPCKSKHQGNNTDVVEEACSGDNHMDTEDEAYVHEAFLEDWRPDDHISLNYSSHKLSQGGASQAKQQIDISDSASASLSSSFSSRPSKPQVILRPYRARRSNSARLVKLAPDLPPVNLPPSVRVMSQSAFQSSQAAISSKISGNYSRYDGKVANGVPEVGVFKKSGLDYLVKSGQVMKNLTKDIASNQQSKHSDKCVADERADPDLQMHPLLFQPPQDASHPFHNTNADDEDEDNDADFELELEEALESDPDEIEERHKRRRNRRQRGSLERNNKFSGQLSRPLRPLLPFAPMGSFPAFNGKHLMSNISPQQYLPSVNNCFTSGFTSHQIGQLHCLFHEHLQLLIQVFSLCVFDPVKGHIALELKELILGLRRKCDQVLAWRSHPYPRFCFILPYIHPSVPVEFHEILPPQCSDENVECEGGTGRHSDITYPSNSRCKDLSNDRTNSFRTEEHTSCVPYICGPLLTVIDVAPLRLVGDYIDDIYTAVSAYERYKIDHGSESLFEKEPLFPLSQSTVSSETEFQGDIRSNPLNSSGRHSPSSNKKMPKKTMAATLVEKAKKQSVALVPKEIAKLAQRFLPLFNPALYPHKPPSVTIANRVLFTDAEDELLALGMMEYNTNWKAIQQRFLPCKSKHQIFVRQKNRASSKAPENPIKAVRRIKNSPLTSEEIAHIEVGLKKLKLDWIAIWSFFVPYRDPSLLPRLWRIASGTQKSYKSDANKKAKRRLYTLRRKEAKPLALMQHSSSEKEGNNTDVVEEACSGDNHMDTEDEAYVHEAFLEDWRPDDHTSLNYSSHKLSQGGASQAKQQIDISDSASLSSSFSSRPSKPQVILRPYRARRSNSARLVKLAPDLPPVNLPPSVRVMSQSAFQSSQAAISSKISGNYSRYDGKVANGVPEVGVFKKSRLDYLVKSGQVMKNLTKDIASNQQSKHSDKCVADERADPDLQMHPLLFQPPQDGRLPYCPGSCSPSPSSSFSLFPGNQTQLDLNLFHNPRHISDAVNFLSKSSIPPRRNSSSSNVDFHPLLQNNDADSIAALPASNQLDNLVSSRACSLVIPDPSCEPSLNENLSTSGRTIYSPSGMGNGLDLDIHLNFKSTNQRAVASGNVTQHGSDKSVRALVSRTIESEAATDLSKVKCSTPNRISDKLQSSDHLLVTSRNGRSRKVGDGMHDGSLPEIIMEQEELSDSEEEFGENVEFECEEMADSEGENTSDSEPFVNTSNEEMQADGMGSTNNDGHVIDSEGDCVVDACTTDNVKPSAFAINLNSCSLVSPHSNPGNPVAKYDFGPFGEIRAPLYSKRPEAHMKSEASFIQKQAMNARKHTVPGYGQPRKRVRRMTSGSSITASRPGQPNIDMNV
ncbi:hypothetical protein F511_20339 [Dorcoceras hygrometricum]|uniref:Uncharacterized protein n=1 Tax=Dorcoceras hygrometricum TaxID=472368 RepID=A0A2Z7C2Y8_9LAMI|nr:hypothetical protein F511_20339 [Dorcoceras hygrometricum]